MSESAEKATAKRWWNEMLGPGERPLRLERPVHVPQDCDKTMIVQDYGKCIMIRERLILYGLHEWLSSPTAW